MGNETPEDVRTLPVSRMIETEAVILVIGQQGVGKSTLGRGLETALPGTFRSGGELIRQEILRETPRGRRWAPIIDAGNSLPAIETYGLLHESLFDGIDGALVLDGFPRTADEISLLVDLVGWPDVVLWLRDVPIPTLVQRIRDRRVCKQCLMPHGPAAPARAAGGCSRCGTELVQRPEDDDRTKITRRHRAWAKEEGPLTALFEDAGNLVQISARPAPRHVLDDAIRALRTRTGIPQVAKGQATGQE